MNTITKSEVWELLDANLFPLFQKQCTASPGIFLGLQKIHKTHLQIHMSWTSSSIQIILLGIYHYRLFSVLSECFLHLSFIGVAEIEHFFLLFLMKENIIK